MERVVITSFTSPVSGKTYRCLTIKNPERMLGFLDLGGGQGPAYDTLTSNGEKAEGERHWALHGESEAWDRYWDQLALYADDHEDCDTLVFRRATAVREFDGHYIVTSRLCAVSHASLPEDL